ncbi:hypothetical protein H4582DRAFT_1962207 [Lactarius indigo]|nr:hypothetical protein H4582DRAFT_1962207 [Lactarius indigo]
MVFKTGALWHVPSTPPCNPTVTFRSFAHSSVLQQSQFSQMESQRTIPSTDPERRHVIPPAAEHPGPIVQPNTPAPRQDANAATQNCPCPQCSDMQRGPQTVYPQQHPRDYDNTFAPYVDQDKGVNNPVEAPMIGPHHMQEQWVAPEAVDNFRYAPVQERAGPLNVGLLQAPILDASITESRRRLAGHFLNNPDAYVSLIRLEPGPSGQFQVIIMLEMANIF